MAPKGLKRRPAAAAESTDAGQQADAQAEDGTGKATIEEPLPKQQRGAEPAEASAEAVAAAPASTAEGAAEEPVVSTTEGSAASQTLSGLQRVLAPIREGLALGQEGGAGAEAQAATLLSVASKLMNEWDLWIGDKPHRIVELEAYVHAPAHQDPYTHGDEGQNCCGVWYFHRKGGSFKAGSFKGMDLACGDGARGVSAGLLLRSVRPLEPAASPVTEGPSVLVDLILKLNGKASISDFVSGRSAAELNAETTAGLCLKPAASLRADRVWPAPRVGLVLRKDEQGKTHMAGGRPADFVARFYRFSAAPTLLSKFRGGFGVAAYLGLGGDAGELAIELGMPKMREYAAAADRGRAKAPEVFADKQISTQPHLCELVGACFAAAHSSSGSKTS